MVEGQLSLMSVAVLVSMSQAEITSLKIEEVVGVADAGVLLYLSLHG